MAIVKARYVERGPKERSKAKAHIRYIETRPGKDRARLTRTLFGADGVMTRQQAFSLIDQAQKGSIFYRMVINPDPKKEDSKRDLRLREITEKTMLQLQKRLNQDIAWVATQHDDHSPKRHIHVLAIVQRVLRTPDLQSLRLTATQAALSQRLHLDLTRGRRFNRFVRISSIQQKPTARSRGGPRIRPRTCMCYHCGLRQIKDYFGQTQHCLRCGSEIRQGRRIILIKKKEAQWERKR